MKSAILFILISLGNCIFISAQQKDSDFFLDSLGIEFNNKPTVIEFWATWCGPCIMYLKEKDPLVNLYKDQINFIAITDENHQKVEKFLTKRKFNYSFFSDTLGKSFTKYGISGIPHTLFINSEGLVVWQGYPNFISEFSLNDLILNKISQEIPKKKFENQKERYTIDSLQNYLFKLTTVDTTYDNKWNQSKFRDQDTYVIWPNRTLKEVFESTLNQPNKNIIIPVEMDSIMNSRLTLLYKNKLESTLDSRLDLINKVSAAYDIKVDSVFKEEDVYFINDIDSVKLNKYKTILSSKNDLGKTGYHVGWRETEKGTFLIGTGLRLKILTEVLNNEVEGLTLKTYNSESQSYDFEIPIYSVEALRRTLENTYGITLGSKKENIAKIRFSKMEEF